VVGDRKHIRGLPARGDLEQAVRLFDERGVTHGEITRLPSFGIDVLSFEDPDGIQLELTADERDALQRSADSVKELVGVMGL